MNTSTNIFSWLTNTICSTEKSVLIDLEVGYDTATVTLIKQAGLTVDELERESLFHEIHLLIKQARQYLEETELEQKALRFKLLDKFEIKLRDQLSFDRSSAKPFIKWRGEKEILAEIFVLLKTTSNKTGIVNTYEDIAVFLKANFDVYKGTELSTLMTTLKALPKKIHDKKNKVDLTFK